MVKKGVVLLGYMGSGKSSVAKELAIQTGFEFIDLDSFIEEKEQQKILELFAEKGEIYFRKMERIYLGKLLQLQQPFVLSLGGGTPSYGDNLNLIHQTANVTSIYLSATVDTLTDRLFVEKEHRPLISHLETREDFNDFIRKHLFERSFYYNQAHIMIKTDGKSVLEIVEEIKQKLF
jgi:shikimate kinase